MNKECKECTYLKECPDMVEPNSIYCKCHKRIPKDRTISYEELEQKVNQLEEELKYTVPIVEHNKIVSEKLKENQQLQQKVNQLETNRDKVIKYIKENNLWSSNKTQNGYSYMKNECRELLSILERGENNEIINE